MITCLTSPTGKNTPEPITKHNTQTPASLLLKISPLALHQRLSLPVLFQQVKHRFSPRLGAAFSRLPNIKNLTWQFILPMFIGTIDRAHDANADPRDTLYQRLLTSTSSERVALLNDAVNTENKADFDKCFDWFNEKLRQQAERNYDAIQRKLGSLAPNQYGQDDCARLMRQGLRLETLQHRYNVSPLRLSGPLASLLSQKVLSAMIAACPLDGTPTSNINEALTKISVLITHLSEALNAESASKGEALFHTLSALEDRPIEQWSGEKKASKIYPELIQFRKSYAKLYWINHYQKFASGNQANAQDTFATNGVSSTRKKVNFNAL